MNCPRISAHCSAGRRRGFSLVELVVSAVAAGLLMAGISSAIFFAVRASDPDETTHHAIQGAMAAEDLVAELRCALSFTERSATAVEFTVPDRDGDNLPDVIRYAWLGNNSAPGPLVRQFNGGPAVTVLERLENCVFSYHTQTVTETIRQTQESAEVELFRFDSAGSPTDLNLTSNRSYGQYFKPSLPASALSWKVTRVLLRAKHDGNMAAPAKVQLRAIADATYQPSVLVLEEVLVDQAQISTSGYQWLSIPYSSITDRSPKEGLCLVLATGSDSPCNIAAGSVTAPSSKLWYTSEEQEEEGTGWQFQSDCTLDCYVYGTYLEEAPAIFVDHQYLTCVPVVLQFSDTLATTIQTSAHLLNAWEIAP